MFHGKKAPRRHLGVHAWWRSAKGQAVGVGVQKVGQRAVGNVEQQLVFAVEEAHRLALHLRAELVLFVEPSARRCAEGAVVEKGDFRIKGQCSLISAREDKPTRVGESSSVTLLI